MSPRRNDQKAEDMYLLYRAGMSFIQVNRMYGRNTGHGPAEMFKLRGWKIREPESANTTLPPKSVKRIRDVNRFWSKVKPTGSGSHEECWIWTAALNHSNYGVFGIGGDKGGTRLAHRVAYELMVDDIPEGLQLDHLCRNPPCVNPWHLDPVPNAVNSARGNAAAASRARGLAITHCRKGHEYTEENTYRYLNRAGGYGRSCKSCARERQRLITLRARMEREREGQAKSAKL